MMLLYTFFFLNSIQWKNVGKQAPCLQYQLRYLAHKIFY